MKKVELNFMVVPEHLLKFGYIKNPVRVRIINVNDLMDYDILGQSGIKLAQAGAEFIFTKDMADDLIRLNIVEKI